MNSIPFPNYMSQMLNFAHIWGKNTKKNNCEKERKSLIHLVKEALLKNLIFCYSGLGCTKCTGVILVITFFPGVKTLLVFLVNW